MWHEIYIVTCPGLGCCGWQRIWCFPFEKCTSGLLWLFLSTILFLGKIIDFGHVSHMSPWKKSKNFKLNVIAGFGYGCAWILLFMLVCSVFPSSHISGVCVGERYPMGSLGLQYLGIFNSDLQENINLKTWTQRWFFLSCLKSKVTFFPTTLVVGQWP